MASNLLSRLLPPATGSPSVYETLREGDESSDGTDIEERAGMAIDDENFAQDDFDIDPGLADAVESQSDVGPSARRARNTSSSRSHGASRQRWLQQSPSFRDADEADDDVPMSLLVESNQRRAPISPERARSDQQQQSPVPIPVLGRPTGATRVKWQATQEQQQLYRDPRLLPSYRSNPLLMIDPKERAMWRWANVENLDNFLKDVYDYFLNNGIWSILLSRLLNLL